MSKASDFRKQAKAVRVIVALRDWGPLSTTELEADVEVSQGFMLVVCETLRGLGWVKRRNLNGRRIWAATEKAQATDNGLLYFGVAPVRPLQRGTIEDWLPWLEEQERKRPAIPSFLLKGRS